MGSRVISKAEVLCHKADCWLIINNSVYDVKAYLNDHPGGADALLEQAGRDATQAFEDVGHSEEARAIKEQYKIGDLPENEKKHVRCSATCSNSGGWWVYALAVIGAAAVASIVYHKINT